MTIALLLAYFVPPVAGLTLFVHVIEFFTADQVLRLMKGLVLPFYIVGSGLGAVFYLLWFLGPVTRFVDGEGSSEEAFARIKSFGRHFWTLYLLRHMGGGFVLLATSHVVLQTETNVEAMFTAIARGLMLSCLVGLPVFSYLMNLFTRAFSQQTIPSPVFRLNTRVFWIAIVIPVFFNTLAIQFIAVRLGGISWGLIALWLILIAFAFLAAMNLMRSLNRSVAELGNVHKVGAPEIRPEELRLQSLDELGVLTCQYRDLLGELKGQAVLLDLRNQVLLASKQPATAEQIYQRLIVLVAGLFSSEEARLLVLNANSNTVEVLSAMGQEVAATRGPETITEQTSEHLRASRVCLVSAQELQSVLPGQVGKVAVIPLHEATASNEQIVVVARLAEGSDEKGHRLDLLELIADDIAAAIRTVRIEREKDKLEQVLIESQRMEMAGRLAAGVAHDFNNILTVVMGSASLLKHQAKLESAVQSGSVDEHAQLILESSGRAAALTRQLLTISKQHVGNVAIIEVNQLVQALESFLRRLLPENIAFSMDLAARNSKVEADAGHLEQVVTNLIVNARDAMPNGGTLCLATSECKGTLHLQVKDDGSGITPEVMAHLFEPFFTTKAEGKGTGLGLATVYGIVTGYAGHVDVASTPGQGTAMTIRLPLAEKHVPSPSIVDAASTQPPERGHARILLVEDEDLIRKVLGDILKSKGYEVVRAKDGEEALKIMRDDGLDIDLLLCDIVMPGIKGTEVASEALKLRPSIKALLMTGYADPAHLQAAKDHDIQVLEKPFDPETLLDAIATLLASRSLSSVRVEA